MPVGRGAGNTIKDKCNGRTDIEMFICRSRYIKIMARGVKNPRQQNGSLRRKYRARFRAMAAPCGICGGRLGPIHYDEPSDPQHPLSFVIDEVKPVSRWQECGYNSARQAAEDWTNLQAAHYCCNAVKSNKIGFSLKNNKDRPTPGALKTRLPNVSDGEW